MRVPTALLAPALLALALLGLSGCFNGLNSSTPPPQVYLLRPVPAAEAGAAARVPAAGGPVSGGVRVTLPQALAGLGTDRIAVLRPGARLDHYRAARWAGTAPEMLQALVLQALRATGRYAWVEADSGPFAAEYLLSLELRDFEAAYRDDGPPSVHVAIDGVFGWRADRKATVSFTAESRVKAEADRMPAVIAAFQRATGEALAQMTGSVASAGAATP